MSNFGDGLRAGLARIEEETRALYSREENERRMAEQKFQAACAMAGALLVRDLRPLVEEFQKIMEDDGVLRDGRIRVQQPGAHRAEAGDLGLTYRALGSPRARRYYEVRLRARVAFDRSTELSAECVHYLPPSTVQPVPPPAALIELPRQSFPSDAIDRDAARAWCENVLTQSAASIVEAVFAPPAPAPIVAPPVFAACDVPAMA